MTTSKRFAPAAIIVANTIAISLACPAHAESVQDFYKGKTITMYIGTGSSSGAVGSYPRNISQVIKDHIPGAPTLVVSNMPGAGGIKLATYIDAIGPQDGTAWAFITRGFLLAPLLQIKGADFDPTKFNWIGSPARTVSVGAVWTSSTQVRTLNDALTTEVVLGATSPAQDTSVFPRTLNALLGTKFKVVTGYKSVGEVDLAMEKGEVQGKVGFTWNSLNSGRSATWVKDKIVTILVQFGMEKQPEIPADVPLALDLVKSPEDRQVLEVIIGPGAMGYPSFMGPNVPQDRIAAIRAAYVATMKDPTFVDLIKKQQLDLEPISADELTKTVKAIYNKPQAAIERARQLIPR